MKEVDLFSTWADSIINEASQPVKQNARMGTPMSAMADRPLPREIDIQYKAQRQYPELSPEQALAKYLEDELLSAEKVDKKQNQQISHIDKEVDDVEQDEQVMKTDISKVEHDEKQIHAQLDRLMQLIQKTQ